MKKNAIGHMMAPKETVKKRLRRWDILPRLFCLLLAMLLWLLIVNTQVSAKEAGADDVEVRAGEVL
ncbi:MAG: hypothetical protein IKD02_03720 [Clostridia bacterium]|nr:hypothetical protein [Clostridia bacterium]